MISDIRRSKIEDFLFTVSVGFQDIGYQPNLIQREYSFADVMQVREPERRIDLAVFGQEPTSYRSACFGIAIASINAIEQISRFKALGAPHTLSYLPEEDEVGLWLNVAEGDPRLLEKIPSTRLLQVIRDRKDRWNPADMLRAKQIGYPADYKQLDMFDMGLLPAIEEIAHQKLDELLRDVISSSKELYLELNNTPLDYRGLYRLIFKLIAAKLLDNRRHIGGWSSSDVKTVLQAIDAYYYSSSVPEPIIINEEVQQLAWSKLQQSFNFQNLSVESIAYVYENTFVDDDTRKALDIHATPPSIAEFIVHQLPFEVIDVNNCRIIEPFAGHAPFLVAAIGRLRQLLPLEMSSELRHEYFTRILTGIELDPFAREAAYNTLRLADFPNPNGWRIYYDDIYASNRISQYFSSADVVLCNPPYSSFTPRERTVLYPSVKSANKAAEALRIVLEYKPSMLGFVLPKSFLGGISFREVRKDIAKNYNDIHIVTMPDITFQYSEAETVLLIAHGRRTNSPKWVSSSVSGKEYRTFTTTQKPTWTTQIPATFAKDKKDPVLWIDPLLGAIEDFSKQLPTLGTQIDIHRGIEYIDNISNHVSRTPLSGYKPGLHEVNESLSLYEIKESLYLNTDPSVLRGGAYQYPWEKPKVIANAARRSRGPWTIEAAIDNTGLICSQRFHGIWPVGELPIEVIAAIINGPVANIYLNLTRVSPPDNQIRHIKQIPIPKFTPMNIRTITNLVQQYRYYKELERGDLENKARYSDLAREIVHRIDSEVWLAYGLPTQLAEDIMKKFNGYNRPSTNDELKIDVHRDTKELQVRPEVIAVARKILDEKEALWTKLSKY
jgi:type I restriction-modification system DNA methylase subunit